MVKGESQRGSSLKKSQKSAQNLPQLKGKAKQSTKAAPVYEDESDEDENYMSFAGNNDNDEDDESAGEGDKAVFDLNLRDDDNDQEESEDDDEGNDDEENYDDDDDENDLEELVKKLPLDLRRKIQSKEPLPSDSDNNSDDNEDEDDEEAGRWGKRRTYWNGDDQANDDDDNDFAHDELEATKELFQTKQKRMKESDYYDDIASDNDDDEEEEVVTVAAQLKRKAQKQRPLPNTTTTSNTSLSEEMIPLTKDVSKLSHDQKLDLVRQHSPELEGLVSDLRSTLTDLTERITPLRDLALQAQTAFTQAGPHDDLLAYLETKQQLLLSYVTNLVFYLYLKSLGRSVRHHPVMKQLLRLRLAIEKLNTLDQKVRYQVDRLVQVAEREGQEGVRQQLLRPNWNNMDLDMSDDDDDAQDEEVEDENEDEDRMPTTKKKSKTTAATTPTKPTKPIKSNSRKQQQPDSDSDADHDDDEQEEEELYQASKAISTPYPNERSLLKQDRKMQKQREKLTHSELYDALQDEFGSTPLVVDSTGGARDGLVSGTGHGDMKRLREEEEEKRNFEEERFVRLTMTKKEKKAIKRREREANRLDNFEDIGDFADLDTLAKLSSASTMTAATGMKEGGKKGSVSMVDSSKALARAFAAFGSTPAAAADADDDSSDGDLDLDNLPKSKAGNNKRRRAPDAEAEEGEDDHGNTEIFDDFLSKKAQYKQKKTEHYTPAPRYGGYEDTLHGDNDKRAASYEIMKNKGLMPHRKKENRNPRVKKREKYEQALVRRKGQVREVITGAAGSYGGEMTGIKANLARSRKM